MPLEQDKAGGIKLPLQQELQSGIYRDLFARTTPLWANGFNVQFTEFGIRKFPGWDQFAITGNGEPIRGLLQQDEVTAKAVYVGDLTKLYRVIADSSSTVEEKGSGYSLPANAGGSVWDSGASVWDSGATIFDDGLLSAGQWSFINYGTFIFATSGFDNPQVKKGVGNFVAMTNAVTGIFLVDGGTGYTEGDTLTLTGGDGTGATAEVQAVSSGVITAVGMTDGGNDYTTAPTGATGGTGSGATFTFTVSDLDVATVEIFLARGPHILGFNTSKSAREVIWCDADDPDTWATAPDNLAGALEIRELKGPIRAAVPLGARIAIYGDDQMFLLNYLGNQLVFGYQPALNGVGAVSKRAVVAVGPRNFGLSQQGFFATDGASMTYIDDPIRYWFRSNAARGQLSKTVAFHDEDNSEIRWYFPTSSISQNTGVAYNYDRNTWTFIESDKTAGEERVVLGHPVTGDSTGRIYAEGLGENDNDSAITAQARSKPIDLGDADRVKELSSIRIGYEGTGLQYRVGWSDTESGTINWGSYRAMADGFDFEHLRTAGRWLHFELYSDTLNADWHVMVMEFIGRVEGTR